MKTERILTRINDAIAPLTADRPDADAARAALELLAADLADQLRLETAAAKGAGSAVRAITAMLKGLRKSDGRTSLHYAWTDSKGRQCVCDGYRAFRLTEHLPLEDRPADAGDPIDLDKIVPAVSDDGFRLLPLPSAAELRAHIAIERAAKRSPLWDFGPDAPTVNALYLADLLAVLPDAAGIYARRGAAGICSPMYASGERGDAVLLPVRCERYADKCAAADRTDADAAKAREADKRRRTLAGLLRCYRDELERNPAYALSPDDFAGLARLA